MDEICGVQFDTTEKILHIQRPHWYSYYALRFDLIFLPLLWWYRKREYLIVTDRRIIKISPKLRSKNINSYLFENIDGVEVSPPAVEIPYSDTGKLVISISDTEQDDIKKVSLKYIHNPEIVSNIITEVK